MHPSPRNALFILLLLVGLICGGMARSHSPWPVMRGHAAAFGSPQLLRVGQSITFVDHLRITLRKVGDSRCPAGVQCIWAGELAPELVLRGGNLRSTRQTLRLGSARARERAIAGYSIALVDASRHSATLVVTRPGIGLPPGDGDGVRGVAMIGPVCPVQRAPPDPNCADRPMAATFSIDTAQGMHVTTFTSAADGSFSIRLPAGRYVIRLQGPAVMPSMAPQTFSVAPHVDTKLRLSLDSGMR